MGHTTSVAPGELVLPRRLKALFDPFRESLGRKLHEEGFGAAGRCLMKALNLKVIAKRKYKVTTDIKNQLPVAENMLNLQFNPSATNQARCTDITYLWSQEGRVSPAVVIDLYSCRVVGRAADRRMKKSPGDPGLLVAINLRKLPPA